MLFRCEPIVVRFLLLVKRTREVMRRKNESLVLSRHIVKFCVALPNLTILELKGKLTEFFVSVPMFLSKFQYIHGADLKAL